MLNLENIQKIRKDTPFYFSLSKDNTCIEHIQGSIPYYGDTKPYQNELYQFQDKGLSDVDCLFLYFSSSFRPIENNSIEWVSAVLDIFSFKKIELKGQTIPKQLLKILALQASSLRELIVNFEMFSLDGINTFLSCDLPHLENLSFQIAELPLNNQEGHARVLSEFLNRHLSNLKRIFLEFDLRSFYQILTKLLISFNNLNDQGNLLKLEDTSLIAHPTLHQSYLNDHSANDQVVFMNEFQKKGLTVLWSNLLSFSLHFAGSLVCQEQMTQMIECLSNKLVEFRFSATRIHTRFSLDCLFEFLRSTDSLRVLQLDLSFAVNVSLGKAQRESHIHLKQLQEFTLIMALDSSAEQVMKIFQFTPQTLSKLSFEIAFITNTSVASDWLFELSDWINQSNESLNYLYCKINQVNSSNDSHMKLSEAIEQCTKLTNLNLIGFEYQHLLKAVLKTLPVVAECSFVFRQKLLIVVKKDHKLTFPSMDQNQKKISYEVIREILRCSTQSIRQIDIPDTIFKGIKNDTLIPSLEFLNFKERIKLLHECNPLLQAINLLSRTQRIEQQLENNFLDQLEAFRNLRSFVFYFSSNPIITPEFRLRTINWISHNYFLETFQLGYTFSNLNKVLSWRRENQNRLRYSIKLFKQTQIPQIFREEVLFEVLSFLA